MEPPVSLFDGIFSETIVPAVFLLFYLLFSSGNRVFNNGSIVNNRGSIPTIVEFLRSFFEISSGLMVAHLLFGLIEIKTSAFYTFLLVFTLSLSIISTFGYLLPSVFVLNREVRKLSANVNKGIIAPFSKPFAKLISIYQKEVNDIRNESEEEAIELIREPEEQKLIKGIASLSSKRAREIMTPLEKIVSIQLNESNDDVYNRFKTSRFSRLPVWDSALENYVGFINIKDLMSIEDTIKDQFKWRAFLREAPTIQSGKSLEEVLEKLRREKTHIAFLKEKKSKIVGMLTMEDVLEEVVGEITDESDKNR